MADGSDDESASDVVDDLVRQTRALLDPGEIDLVGVIVHTDVGADEEPKIHRLTLEVGDIIADHATVDGPTYVYSGNDDPDFSSNQHQGLTVSDDDFVWECQQLLRDDTFDLVFYYETSADQETILEALRERDLRVTGVEPE